MKNFFTIKTCILSIIVSVVFLSSCNHRTIKGSGNVSSETRTVSDFNSVEVSSALKVIYTEGPEYKIEVVADDNLIKYITTELHGNELQIGIQNRKSFKNVTKTEVHITAPSLSSIEASGASKFEAVNTIHTNALTLKLSGASTAFFITETSSLKGDLSGASTANLSGSSTSVSWEGSGASVYNAENLTTKAAVINFSGASSAVVRVNESLFATLSGASKVDYFGNPTTVNANTSGASSVNKR